MYKTFPKDKKKAFVLSYDDGVLQDVRLVGLLNKYGLKGTFNLNSGLMQSEYEWTHECGMTVKRMPLAAAKALYRGHEVASHSLTHPYLAELSEAEITRELASDRENLCRATGMPVTGFALPFDRYSDGIEACVKACGFEYARISEVTHSFAPPEDFYRLRAGMFHLESGLNEFVDDFLAADAELSVCMIVGHSYDLDAACAWGMMEGIFKRIAEADDVLSMTTAELVAHLKATGAAR